MSQEDYYVEAAQKGNLEIVRELVEKMTHAASLEGHYELVKLLVNHRTDIDQVLLKAASRGHLKIVKLCLKQGAIPDPWDDNKWTPLMWAAYRGHDDLVELLLEAGANPNVSDDAQRSPLSLANQRQHKKITKLLKKAGAK
ncbi:MAG: ankyrin repeat domain-containing protein [SAR324 cluster bacterium]|nr:ankyrin repeat domain-containing protein [SAR324 cluster bacterium]